MQYKLVVGITMLLGAIAITGAGCVSTNQSSAPAASSSADAMAEKQKIEEREKAAMMEKQKMEEKEKADAMEKERTMALEKTATAEKEAMMDKAVAGMYKDYSPAALAEATKNGGKAVLFFWAAWCPYCKEANADFLANTSKIPNNVTVLKTNYDTEKDLKTKYGVTYQHTFVQVDAQGNQITKWNGGGTQALINNLK
ncbi:MAG: thioredoxin family protein [Candidatus Magasanikbacteria bacterium]|nr:thioredoxin family protein [Candidatus Magasanikbacteria bacterium]